jgi:hypothetical protein
MEARVQATAAILEADARHMGTSYGWITEIVGDRREPGQAGLIP